MIKANVGVELENFSKSRAKKWKTKKKVGNLCHNPHLANYLLVPSLVYG